MARNEAALNAFAAELNSACGVPVHVIVADLNRETATAEPARCAGQAVRPKPRPGDIVAVPSVAQPRDEGASG